MVEHDISLAVDKGAVQGRARVVARVGDVGTQVVNASLTKGGVAYSPGGTARLEVLKADGTWCRCGATVSGSEVSCTLPDQALSSPGVARLAYFVLVSGDDQESTECFELRVLAHVDSSGPESENYDDQLSELYSEYVAKLGGMDDLYQAEEAERQSAYQSAESARESAFSQAQQQRQGDYETAETQRQTDYEQAEAARDAAQSENDSAQQANDEAQDANDAAQAKNNADQAANNSAAQGLVAVILSAGEYDPDTLEPTVSGEVGKMYLVPMPQAQAVAAALPVAFTLEETGDGTYAATRAASAEDGDVYVEWLWINSAWERIGLSTATIDPITTDQVDAVAAGSAPQGKQVLNLTGLSYLWAKLKSAFAALSHTHTTAQVSGLDSALAGKAASSHTHAASDVTSGTLAADRLPTVPVAKGGTGATSASAALASLGAASASDLDDVRDSLSRRVSLSSTVTESHVSANVEDNMPIQLQCSSSIGTYTLICSLTFIGLFDSDEDRYVWRQQIL